MKTSLENSAALWPFEVSNLPAHCLSWWNFFFLAYFFRIDEKDIFANFKVF